MSRLSNIFLQIVLSVYVVAILLSSSLILYFKGYFLEAIDFVIKHNMGSILTFIIMTFIINFIFWKIKLISKIPVQSKWFQYLIFFIITMTSVVFATIYLFLLQKNYNLNVVFDYLFRYKARTLVSFICLIGLNLLFVSVIRNIYIGNLIYLLVVFLLGQVHYYKQVILGEPLYPSDFGLIATLGEVAPMVKKNVSILPILLGIIIFISFLFIQRYLPKVKIHLIVRLLLLCSSLFILYSFAHYEDKWTNKFMKDHQIVFIKFNQPSNYAVNGPVIGFMGNFSRALMAEPKNYSKDEIKKIVKEIPTTKKEPSKINQKPNILFIMSESFWDASKLTNLHMQDPIPNIHRIMAENTSGNLLSPTFGGGTSSVEYEALTGQSYSFLRPGAIPYQDGLAQKKDMPSFVSVLKDYGYSIEAMHPYNPAFYKRNKVYPVLGFTKFYNQNTMKHTAKFGDHISDDSVTLELIDLLKQKSGPKFIHTVTMQNHMPYDKSINDETYFNQLKPENNKILSNYVKGIHASDLAIKKLTDFLDTFEEPTIVVFWGDHLPSLGYREIYNEAGYKAKTTLQNIRMFSETPFFVYTNYDVKVKHYESLSPSFLSTIVFDQTGLTRPPYFDLLTEVRDQMPGIKRDYRLNPEGGLIQNLTTEQQNLINQYKLVQYDTLQGKHYMSKKLFKVK